MSFTNPHPLPPEAEASPPELLGGGLPPEGGGVLPPIGPVLLMVMSS
ncbi:MAG: hypothetical protein AABY39_07855 [Nitrospirota bacterium]